MFGQINVQLRLCLQSHAYLSIQNNQKAIATLFLYAGYIATWIVMELV